LQGRHKTIGTASGDSILVEYFSKDFRLHTKLFWDRTRITWVSLNEEY